MEDYWKKREADLKFAIENNKVFRTTTEDLQQEILFLKSERERLVDKLKRIDNLSKHAWEQVDRNPEEAKELFKQINFISK
jgi:hypothetical protein